MPRSNKLCDCGRPVGSHYCGNTYICDKCYELSQRHESPAIMRHEPSAVNVTFSSFAPGFGTYNGMTRRHTGNN